MLYPGFAELNLNKKVQGAKKSNKQPVITLEDAGLLKSSVTLTWRMVVSILDKLYDPCGFWEPWKLQLKLLFQSLAGMDWDEYIPVENQDLWKQLLSKLVDFPKLSIPRINIPADRDSVTRLYNGLTYLQNNKVDFWFYQLLKDLFKYYYVEADILKPLCNI